MEVQLSGNKISAPPICACCGAPPNCDLVASAERTKGKRVIRTEVSSYAFPYCQECLNHVRAWPEEMGCGMLLLALITLGLALIPYYSALNAAKARVRAMCSPNCTTPTAAVQYVGWHGTSRAFWFSSDRFALAFMLANKSKLVNVDWKVRELLEASTPKLEAKITPKVVAAPLANDDQATFEKAIAKLESAKGPASRRTALERALQEIQAPYLRDRLVLEASRVEVEAALAKADGLKTPSAKRRVLDAALAEVRNDPVPDALQVQQIKWLEDAISELDG